MMYDPIDRYELEKARQQQVWSDAEQERRAREATAVSPQQTAHMLSRIGALPGALALWLKARGKAPPVLTSSRIPVATKAPASGCQRTAASALNHVCLQPILISHPQHATRAEHVRCYSSSAHEAVS